MVALSKRAPLAPEILTSPSQLEALAGDWAHLLARSGADEPMRSPLWTCAWWRCYGGADGRRLRAAAFRQGGRLVGLAPLAYRRLWRPPGLAIRRLDLIPSGERERDEVSSDYLGLVTEPGYEQRVAEGLAQLLDEGVLGSWDELVMPAMSLDGASVPLLVGALEKVGAVRFDVTGGAPYIPLPRTWDEYLAALPSSRRRMVKTSLRAFDAWTSGDASLQVVRTEAELERGARILRDLHAARWRADGQAGAFASTRFSAFHAEVMPALLSRGALELMWLCAHGEPVAAVYNIVWNDKVYFYQSGRRPDLPRQVRAGLVLHALAIRRAIELKRREYDFLNGGSRYKLDLALASRPLGTLRVRRRGRTERVVRLYERSRSIARAVRASRGGRQRPPR
ncbi:MAG TPA: GNAT family N-acetyltransferase [Kofleriaceae bacterium]|nr:GNAT family N-acetyltransferase [Kofleriaceae bacterium]